MHRSPEPSVEIGVELEVVRLAVVLDAAVEAEPATVRLAVEPGAAGIAIAAEQPRAEAKAVGPELQTEVERVAVRPLDGGGARRWRCRLAIRACRGGEHDDRGEHAGGE